MRQGVAYPDAAWKMGCENYYFGPVLCGGWLPVLRVAQPGGLGREGRLPRRESYLLASLLLISSVLVVPKTRPTILDCLIPLMLSRLPFRVSAAA